MESLVTLNESFLRDRTLYKKVRETCCTRCMLAPSCTNTIAAAGLCMTACCHPYNMHADNSLIICFSPLQTQPNGATTWVYVPTSNHHSRSQSAGSPVAHCAPSPSNAQGQGAGRKAEPCCTTRGKSVGLEEEIKRKNGSPVMSNRYKTELCRPYQETGFCKYGEKCQFAHGTHELRVIPKHPKFKTELCRTYHANGYCPYGLRCHFIHNLDEARKASSSTDSCGNGSSPRKSSPPISFSAVAPMSPSVDSGISSPDDLFSYSAPGKVFSFAQQDVSSSLADEAYYASTESAGSGWDSYSHYSSSPETGSYFGREMLDSNSPDPFDFDVSSSSGSSPMKTAFTASLDSSNFNNLNELFANLSFEDTVASSSTSSLTSNHRLPVFDDIMYTSGSRSEFSLENAIADTVNNHNQRHQLA